MGVRVEGINEAIAFVEDVTEDAIGLIGIELTGRVVERTPVDTGFAQNSWLMTTNRDDEGTPGNNDPAGSAEIVAGSYGLGDVFYINNGAEYIGALENGHSDKAPNGMVAVTLTELDQIADGAVRGAKREGRA